MRRHLGLVVLIAAGCADPAAQPSSQTAARDTAAVLSPALIAHAERFSLDLEGRLWLDEAQPGMPISDEVFSELSLVVPGLRRVSPGVDVIQCEEGQIMWPPASVCPIAEDGVRVGFWGLSFDDAVGRLNVEFVSSFSTGSQEIHLVRGLGGNWVLKEFGTTVVS